MQPRFRARQCRRRSLLPIWAAALPSGAREWAESGNEQPPLAGTGQGECRPPPADRLPPSARATAPRLGRDGAAHHDEGVCEGGTRSGGPRNTPVHAHICIHMCIMVHDVVGHIPTSKNVLRLLLPALQWRWRVLTVSCHRTSATTRRPLRASLLRTSCLHHLRRSTILSPSRATSAPTFTTSMR